MDAVVIVVEKEKRAYHYRSASLPKFREFFALGVRVPH
jgi:hypothetical protein